MRFRTERRRALCLLVHANVCVEPPVLAVFVDFALADEERGVQPAVRRRFARQLEARGLPDSGED